MEEFLGEDDEDSEDNNNTISIFMANMDPSDKDNGSTIAKEDEIQEDNVI